MKRFLYLTWRMLKRRLEEATTKTAVKLVKFLLWLLQLGVHYGGRHYEFIPWVEDGSVSWEIEPWGRWHMTGKRADYEVGLHLVFLQPERTLSRVLLRTERGGTDR